MMSTVTLTKTDAEIRTAIDRAATALRVDMRTVGGRVALAAIPVDRYYIKDAIDEAIDRIDVAAYVMECGPSRTFRPEECDRAELANYCLRRDNWLEPDMNDMFPVSDVDRYSALRAMIRYGATRTALDRARALLTVARAMMDVDYPAPLD